jgi:putative phosphoesterase
MLAGIVSDTHGYVDPRMIAALAGVDAIVHAGDVGGAHVLAALSEIAPVHAVYGNNDEKTDTLGLPFRADFGLGGKTFHLVHQLPHAEPPPDTSAVVYGHSHRALIEERAGVLFINPGAAGRAGFHRVQTIVRLKIGRARIDAEIVELGAREPIARRTRTTRSE